MRTWRVVLMVEDDESRDVTDVREAVEAFTSICAASLDEERGLNIIIVEIAEPSS